MTYENVICVPRASLGVMAHQFALAGPAKISANKGKERNKHRGVEIIYTIHYPHKSRYTSNRRYAIRNRKITKEKKKQGKHKERRIGRHRRRHLILRHGPRGHATVRAHEIRGDPHLWSSNSIELSRGRWSRCVCRDACSELFQGGKLRWKSCQMARDCA